MGEPWPRPHPPPQSSSAPHKWRNVSWSVSRCTTMRIIQVLFLSSSRPTCQKGHGSSWTSSQLSAVSLMQWPLTALETAQAFCKPDIFLLKFFVFFFFQTQTHRTLSHRAHVLPINVFFSSCSRGETLNRLHAQFRIDGGQLSSLVFQVKKGMKRETDRLSLRPERTDLG